MKDKRGVAFIGAGFISYMHNYALRVDGRARLLAVASNSRRGAVHRAHLFGAEPYAFADLDAMLQRPDIDTVFVLSPNALHARHAFAAIEAGKHLVIEKPLALTAADAGAIVERAARARLCVGYAENQVFAPVVRKAREVIAEGAIGRVRQVTAFVGHGGPPAGWFWDPALAGGGAQFDLGSHTVETALYLAGHPNVVEVTSARLTDHSSGVDSHAEAHMVAEGGVEFSLTTSFAATEEAMWYEVRGERGAVRCVYAPAPMAQQVTLSLDGAAPQDVDFPHRYEVMRVDRFVGSMGYVEQLAHFLDCIENGSTPSESAADGARVLDILAAIYLAAGRGGPVKIGAAPTNRTPLELWRGGA